MAVVGDVIGRTPFHKAGPLTVWGRWPDASPRSASGRLSEPFVQGCFTEVRFSVLFLFFFANRLTRLPWNTQVARPLFPKRVVSQGLPPPPVRFSVQAQRLFSVITVVIASGMGRSMTGVSRCSWWSLPPSITA